MSRGVITLLLILGACSTDEEPRSYPTTGDRGAGDTYGGDSVTGDTQTGDTQTGDTQTGDTQTGDTQAGDTRPGDAGAAGPLCVFPAALIFPSPAVGVPASTSAFSYGTVSLTNCSSTDLLVHAPALSSNTDPEIAIEFPPFSDTTTLSPWDTVLVELRFSPEQVGGFTGALEITHDGGTTSVALAGTSSDDPGTCLLQLGPTLTSATDPLQSAMEYSPTAANAAGNDTFMLVNIGRTPCTVTEITVGGAPFSFTYPNQVATPITLSFRQLKLINLGYQPTAAGSDTTTVTATGDDGVHAMTVTALAY